jgi:hypothetical protein
MKKCLFALVTGFISITAFGHGVQAQNGERPHAFMQTKQFASSVRHVASWESPESRDFYITDEKKINFRAYKDFQVRFKQVENASWFYDPKVGFVSYFVRSGYGNRVIYDKKGRWLYSLIIYGEDELPRDIRTRIKSTYFDFTITLVEEVQTTEGTEYVVYLEDKSTIRILTLNRDGDIQTVQEMEKG